MRISPSGTIPFPQLAGTEGPSHGLEARLSAAKITLLPFGQVEGYFVHFSVKYHEEEGVPLRPEKQQRPKPYADNTPHVIQVRKSISRGLDVL